MKSTKLVLKVFFLSMAAEVVCSGIYDIYWGYVYQLRRDLSRAFYQGSQLWDLFWNPDWFVKCYSHDSFLRGCLDLLALILLVSLVAFWRSTSQNELISRLTRKCQFGTWPLLDMGRSQGYFNWLRRGGVLIINTSLVVAMTYTWPVTWTYGFRDLAYATDGLGFYEFGERIYSLTSDPRGTTLASTCGMDGHDSDQMELASGRLNNTVAEIYGPQSLQMANRYSMLASHLPGGDLEDYVAEGKYRQKAVSIYKKFDRRIDCATNLGSLAFCQVKSGYRLEARKSLAEAQQLIKTSHPTAAERAFAVFILDNATSVVEEKM